MKDLRKMLWKWLGKNSQILAEFCELSFMHLKMAESLETFVHNFNKSSLYSTQVF